MSPVLLYLSTMILRARYISTSYKDFEFFTYGAECSCDPGPGLNCSKLHENLKYGYFMAGGHCYGISPQKIAPQHIQLLMPPVLVIYNFFPYLINWHVTFCGLLDLAICTFFVLII